MIILILTISNNINDNNISKNNYNISEISKMFQ